MQLVFCGHRYAGRRGGDTLPRLLPCMSIPVMSTKGINVPVKRICQTHLVGVSGGHICQMYLVGVSGGLTVT